MRRLILPLRKRRMGEDLPMSGLDDSERAKILGLKAARLWKFEIPERDRA